MTKSSRKRSALFQYLGKLLLHDFVLPTRRLLALAAAGAVPVGAAAVWDAGMTVFWVYNALLAVLTAADLLLLPRRSVWSAERQLPERMDVRKGFEVKIGLRAAQPTAVRLAVNDDLPSTFSTSRNRLSGSLDGTEASFYYTAMAQERGRYGFKYLYVRYWGGLGLWVKQLGLELPGSIDIYPDLSQVRGVLGAAEDALILEGSRLFKKQRSGSEFHYIRDYVQGDDPRHINWKASARSARLMSNMFQPEKGKVVTLVLDCGRLMGVELAGQVKLDRTLEAALVLAAVALKQGDQVALLAFSSRVKLYVPPGKGLLHLQELTRAVFDLRADFVESSYRVALSHLLYELKKRSLVVLFSDMEGYLYDSELPLYAQRLRRRHHLLLLSLNDPLLHDWARISAEDSRQAFIQSAAHKFTLDRKSYVNKMAGQGIPVQEVPADQLTLSAVNAYLELKSRDAL